MPETTRRDALAVLGLGLAGALGGPNAKELEMSSLPMPRPRTDFAPRPLPFNPAKLAGLSEPLIRSHWENNYSGSVKALNVVQTRLASAMEDPAFPASIYAGLKREELNRLGSVVLHELYFENLGGNGRAGGEVSKGLASSFGSFDAWEAEFRRTAMSLAGGSGWCVLTYHPHTNELRNQWAPDHLHSIIGGTPLLVLDMYEHAFHIDYGAAAAKYVDAWFANVDWEIVDNRYRNALRGAALMQSPASHPQGGTS